MWIKAIETKLVSTGDSVNDVLASTIVQLPERSVVVMASKIFSYAENRMVRKKTADKAEKWALAKKESDWWLDPNESKYQCMLTIKGNWMFANGGIDESNAEGKYFALWPKDPQASVNATWRFLREHFGVNEVGVIMSDSRSLPLNWGVCGHGIAYCGFEPLYSYIGRNDLHGRPMQMEQVNMVQSLAVAGTVEMGEGAERTPIAIISGIKHVTFTKQEPSTAEIEALKPDMKDDIYAPLLTRAPWQKGGGGQS